MRTPTYEADGQGPVCLALAPIGAPWFRRTLPQSVFDCLRIVFVEPSGTGRTPGDPETVTIDDVVAELEHVRRDLDADEVLVFGHSANGLVALAYAAAHPDTTAGVIAVGTPPTGPVDRVTVRRYWEECAEPQRRARFDELLEAGGRSPEGSEEQNSLYRRADALRRWYDVSFDPSSLDSLGTLNRAWVKRVLVDDASTRDWDRVFDAVTAPVLLVLGRRDFVAPASLWDGPSSLARLTKVVLERSGHQPFFDEPERFMELLREWLHAEVTGSRAE